jgi:3-hydroxymyristoyl/3-hydroxydecanoyl-(acyl carrier protein) dehydratase
MRFASDHPTAAGHFPGYPIIPGALLLDAVLVAIRGAAATRTCRIRAAKFLRPVRPGDRLRIEWTERDGKTEFRCLLLDDDAVAATGALSFGTD